MKSSTIVYLLQFCLLSLIEGKTVTYDGLGTFSDQPPWGGTDERPGNYLPSTPDDVKTRFYLDTRRKKDVEIFNTDMTSLGKTTFDSKKYTRIIVHGFLQNGDTTWLEEISESHLAKEDINSIRVGWIGSSVQLNYFQSATDTQIVGAEIGLLIKNIINSLGGDASRFHCVGHSLGAHSCSYASNYVSSRGLGKFSRITGLDPAGPYFQSTPDEVRLESTDADFVDVIHTDAEKLVNLGYGINQESGHVDFWPNDGLEQPGCDQNGLTTIWDPDGIWTGVQNFVACNHIRAVEFYLESILTSCPFYGYPCLSYFDYLSGKCMQCDRSCISMGYNAINSASAGSHAWSTNFYLATNIDEPYCEYVSYIQVHTATNSDEVEGRLFLSIYGSNGNTEQVQLSDEGVSLDLRPNRVYSYTTHFLTFPDNVDRVKLLWYQDEWTVTRTRLNVDTISVLAGHLQKTLNFCGDSSVEMESERRYEFTIC